MVGFEVLAGPLISVITATLNCARSIPALVETLLTQTDQEFEWVVVDGGSADSTLDAVRQFPAARLKLISGTDFGIYDALNKGVRASEGEFYLVVGADDQLFPNSIERFAACAREGNADLIAASVSTTMGTLRPLRGARWWYGGNAYVASHAVGTLIRKSLHQSVGMYSNRYVNIADMYFVLSAVDKVKAKVQAATFVSGCFGINGISSRDKICSLSEFFRIQLACGENRLLQFSLYCGRLLVAMCRLDLS